MTARIRVMAVREQKTVQPFTPDILHGCGRVFIACSEGANVVPLSTGRGGESSWSSQMGNIRSSWAWKHCRKAGGGDGSPASAGTIHREHSRKITGGCSRKL